MNLVNPALRMAWSLWADEINDGCRYEFDNPDQYHDLLEVVFYDVGCGLPDGSFSCSRDLASTMMDSLRATAAELLP